ncbi:hypothetical protein FACS189494_10470 [Spirochaetia bacterium]|nr:hypothetical protein FACS189494_10470 [Spirochaetia bacterium]
MQKKVDNQADYQKICSCFKKQRAGITIADVVAKTALPLETVRSLAPVAADEYSARLRVTESGEILYSFSSWTSKYKGFKAVFSRGWQRFKKGLKIAAMGIFKVWIMLMLVGYFVVFMLIALAAMLLSVAANNSNSGRRSSGGGLGLTSGIFDFIIRIWFYSELTNTLDRRYNNYGIQRSRKKTKGAPLYKAIFSFVFGDGDPNADIESREKAAVIAYIQANNGVITLPEFMTLTGTKSTDAELRITEYCVQYGGSPEASEDGTVIYQFDVLMLRADKKDRSFLSEGFSAPLKRLRQFSSNKTKSNVIFSIINFVNLIFGGYFLVNALNTGHIITQAQFNASSYVYGVTYILMRHIMENPLPVLIYGLGIVPLVFSILFWFIPFVRSLLVKKENENIKYQNLRKTGYGFILDNPQSVKENDIKAAVAECKPKNWTTARNKIIIEMGSYSQPEVSVEGNGETVYKFNDLIREKEAVEKIRSGVDKNKQELGKPEPLREDKSGYWSRRIDGTNRIVYRVLSDDSVELVELRTHYQNKNV